MVPASTSGGTQSARSADISLICWEYSPACNNARLPHFMNKGTHTLNTPPAEELSPLRVGYCSQGVGLSKRRILSDRSRCTFFFPLCTRRGRRGPFLGASTLLGPILHPRYTSGCRPSFRLRLPAEQHLWQILILAGVCRGCGGNKTGCDA